MNRRLVLLISFICLTCLAATGMSMPPAANSAVNAAITSTPSRASVPFLFLFIPMVAKPGVGPESAPFPSTSKLDNFNQANGPIGPQWSGQNDGYAVISQQLAAGMGGDIYWQAASYGPDQEIHVTLNGFDPQAGEISLLLKSQSPASWANGVVKVSYSAANQSLQVSTYSPGLGWQPHGPAAAASFQNGDQFGARASGQGWLGIYRNGGLTGEVNISGWDGYPQGGWIGLWISDAPGTLLDEFSGGNYSEHPLPATATATITRTAGATSAPSQTQTATRTATPTRTNTATATRTHTPTSTQGSTPAFTPTATQTYTPTSTQGSTPAFTSTATQTHTPTSTQSSTPAFTSTAALTHTPTSTPSSTPTFTATLTYTPTSTQSNTPTFTATQTYTPTSIPSSTPTFTATATQTHTPTSTQSSTPTFTATATASQPPPTGIAAFMLGTGGSDVIPHQIVRAGDDRLYIFAYGGDASRTLYGYWTTGAGFPSSAANFAAASTTIDPAVIISVETVYDGSNTIHVLTNSTDGILRDRPFDITTHTFKAAKTIATGLITANTNAGTSGVSAGMDSSGRLHIAYWSGGNHITYQAYSYDPATDTLTLADGPTQLDLNGQANHPSLAVSPLDQTVTVAWISEATDPAVILARTLTGSGWGSIETVSTSPVWTSPNSGINIDQGPSLLIDSAGTRHLAYIEDYRLTTPFDYGRVHYVTKSASAWSDTYTGFYTHNPALALNAAGQIYIIGHGHSLNQAPCLSELDMCAYQRITAGSWNAQLVAQHQGSNTFDSSPSVKWSAVGFNRPDVIEFIFPEIIGGSYANSRLYYGRIGAP